MSSHPPLMLGQCRQLKGGTEGRVRVPVHPQQLLHTTEQLCRSLVSKPASHTSRSDCQNRGSLRLTSDVMSVVYRDTEQRTVLTADVDPVYRDTEQRTVLTADVDPGKEE